MKHHFLKDNQLSCHLVCFEPKEKPKAVIQLVHGMAEYIERYQEFAQYLVSQGYAVVGHDHLGHGLTVENSTQKYGYFTQNNPVQKTLHLIDLVSQWINTNFENIPKLLMGHSMGSFAIRAYLQSKSTNYAGVILMGTGKKPQLLPIAQYLTKTMNYFLPAKRNYLLDKLAFGSYSKHFKEKSRFSWLSKNQINVKNYEQDELLGFTFTTNGFYTLFELIKRATHKNWANNLKSNVPFLIISGHEDPVGDYGKGPKFVNEQLKNAGFKTSLVLFKDLRHELLFEIENKQIYQTITDWIEKNILQK